MTPRGRRALKTNSIVCPFCSLACDDLVIDQEDSTLETNCDLAEKCFRDATATVPSRLGNKTLEGEEWKTLIDRLSLPKVPIVAASALTFQESRQVQTWQAEGRLTLSARVSDSNSAWDRSVSREGIQLTTLGDARRHVDRLWMIGKWQENAPRVLDRLSINDKSFDPIRTDRLSLLHLEHLHQLTSTAQSNGQKTFAETEDPVLRDIHTCRYFVVFVGESAFADDFETAVSDSLVRLINRWNELATSDGHSFPRTVVLQLRADQNLRSVMMWSGGKVNASSLFQPSQIDIRLGTAAIGDSTKATLQLGGRDGGPESSHAFIATQVAGVHYDGTTLRGDGSVTLPLVGWTHSPRPSVTEALEFAIQPPS